MTDEDRAEQRKSPADVAWRKAVYARDDYICALCYKHCGKDINAHHLDNWNEYPAKRYDIDNGIVLCDACHGAFHAGFRKNGITRKNFVFAKMYMLAAINRGCLIGEQTGEQI